MEKEEKENIDATYNIQNIISGDEAMKDKITTIL